MEESKKNQLSTAFLPRTITTRVEKTIKKPKGSNRQTSFSVLPSNKQHESDDDDVVKTTNDQQRWPNTEEPVCVMCGKYGEYICDETDEDVCSLQCKAEHLAKEGISKRNDAEKTGITNTTTIPLQKSNSHQTTSLYLTGSDSNIVTTQTLTFDEHFSKVVEKLRKGIDSNYDREQCRFFREKFMIKTKGDSVPKLILDFKHCTFSDQLFTNLQENNYVTPTPVQMQVIPVGLSGQDSLVSAATTSGKTASFLLPIIHTIHQCLNSLSPVHPFCKHPIALIMAPTRELCMQIEEQAKAMCKGLGNMKTCLLVGGMPLPQQLYRLRHKIQIVIGTPGRINDVIDNHAGKLKLHQIKTVVLDEVDVMLQMGFQNQIDRILADVPPVHQHLMFSATIPAPIEQLADRMMKQPVYVSVGDSGVTSHSVHEIVIWVEEVSKRKKLFSIICEPKHFRPPVLVFVESKMGADLLCDAIKEKLNITCESIHSDKDQSERNAILHNFLTGGYKLLISTNVMGRGIDLPNVRQVIIFDMPKTIEEYVHQVGRAGRLHSTGFVMAFVNKGNKNIFHSLIKMCEKNGTKLPDELVNSPYLQSDNRKGKQLQRKEEERREKLKRKKWDEQEVNQKSLLEILMKKRR